MNITIDFHDFSDYCIYRNSTNSGYICYLCKNFITDDTGTYQRIEECSYEICPKRKDK